MPKILISCISTSKVDGIHSVERFVGDLFSPIFGGPVASGDKNKVRNYSPKKKVVKIQKLDFQCKIGQCVGQNWWMTFSCINECLHHAHGSAFTLDQREYLDGQ